jgi:hypothetical protein
MRISDEDEAFLRKWFEGIATKNGFEKKYRDFMEADPGDEPRLGSNRRILNDFIDAGNRQPLAAYTLSLYSHTTAGHRASLAFRVTEITVGISIATAGAAVYARSSPELLGGILFAYGAVLVVYLMVRLWRQEKRIPN